MPQESTKTLKAREKIKEILVKQGYEIAEEEVFPCKNNCDEVIFPYYQGDIVARKTFIIELDPMPLHGTARRRNHDQWRDKNILREYNIKTVRLDPKDINKQEEKEIFDEIDSQLKRDSKT